MKNKIIDLLSFSLLLLLLQPNAVHSAEGSDVRREFIDSHRDVWAGIRSPSRDIYAWTRTDDGQRSYVPPFAFPGAEGFGSNSTGGRPFADRHEGRLRIIRVNTLKDFGSVSTKRAEVCAGIRTPDPDKDFLCDFRTALSQTTTEKLCGDDFAWDCPRFVVFEVGGLIRLEKNTPKINIKQPYLMIAGQTAPQGIRLMGQLEIGTHDVVIQHIAVHPESCMDKALDYCDNDEDCYDGIVYNNPLWRCERQRCRIDCSASALLAANSDKTGDQYCQAHGFPTGGCLEHTSDKGVTGYRCACKANFDAIELQPNCNSSYYRQFASYGCPELTFARDDGSSATFPYENVKGICLPEARGSLDESVCQCGDSCSYKAADASLQEQYCKKTKEARKFLGCTNDSDCQKDIILNQFAGYYHCPKGKQMCIDREVSAGCIGGFCAPLPPPPAGGLDDLAREQLNPEVYNIVLDHVALRWGSDELLGITGPGVHDVTISNSIFARAASFGGQKYNVPHAMGAAIAANTSRVSFIGNFFAHNRGRNPTISQAVSAFFVNNIVYNLGFDAVSFIGASERIGPSYLSIWSNIMVTGNDSLIYHDPEYGGLYRDDPYFSSMSPTGEYGYNSLLKICDDEHAETEDGEPVMPFVHVWAGAHPESEIWVGYNYLDLFHKHIKSNRMSRLYSEWGAMKELISSQNKECKDGKETQERSGGPSVEYFKLDAALHAPVDVRPLTQYYTCDELLQRIIAKAGPRPIQRHEMEQKLIDEFLIQDRRGYLHIDETICKDNEKSSGIQCDEWRCGKGGAYGLSGGCIEVDSWDFPDTVVRRRILLPGDVGYFATRPPFGSPEPSRSELIVPLFYDKKNADGYYNFELWLHELAHQLNDSPIPDISCNDVFNQ